MDVAIHKPRGRREKICLTTNDHSLVFIPVPTLVIPSKEEIQITSQKHTSQLEAAPTKVFWSFKFEIRNPRFEMSFPSLSCVAVSEAGCLRSWADGLVLPSAWHLGPTSCLFPFCLLPEVASKKSCPA